MPRKRDETIDYLDQHEPFFSDKEEKTEIGSFKKGNVIRFDYDGKIRHVFVVHPMWEGLVHGLDLKKIRRREFLIVANAPEDLSEHQLYEGFIKGRHQVKDADAYRCYSPKKMTGLRTIVYDSSLQPGEKSEHHIEEAPQISKGPQIDEGDKGAGKGTQERLSRLRDQALGDVKGKGRARPKKDLLTKLREQALEDLL